jgi:miniconductance mechanosensitive channel
MWEQLQSRLESVSPWLLTLVGIASLLVVAVVVDHVLRRSLVAVVRYLASRTAARWNDALTRHKVFSRLSHVLPALVFEFGISMVPNIHPAVVSVTQNVALAFVAFTVTFALTSALSAGNDVYEATDISRERPLKGIIQVAQIVAWVVGVVLIVAALIDKSPLLLLSGVGAMTAVLLLVFKDTILGLVASIQLSANDMVRVGDWIEMPACGADGDVIEVALHTVKVQNWDKTITTIPTYRLIADSFKNWRGMSEAGGRRIKRSIHIDQQSIRFLTDDEITKLKRFALLREHFESKRRELDEASGQLGDAAHEVVNRRRLTNIGVFRAYVRSYLRAHAQVHDAMTLMVRHLEPGPEGLPIQIYCFTKTTEWLPYEDIQSDIFDHLLAILPEFGLRVFQQPAGSDLSELVRSARNEAA